MAPGSKQRSPYVIPVMVLFIAGLLIFIAVLVSYINSHAPAPSVSTITPVYTFTSVSTPSPSTTSTITLTPRPTWTLRPSATASLTPSPTSTSTATLLRTLTPVTPVRLNTFYELKPWDLAEQVKTVELMKVNSILVGSTANFQALAYVEGEAILRFPESLEATPWRWDRAYNLVRIHDPVGISLYSQLIQDALDANQTRASDLPTWFTQNETRLTVKVSELQAQPGELGRELMELVGEGSAYLWLVENPGGAKIYPLLDDIDFTQPHENAFRYGELTGDASPELVIYRQNTPGSTLLLLPHIFDLSAMPPRELPIQEQVPVDFGLEPRTGADLLATDRRRNTLKVEYIVLPACPAYISQEYSWDGSMFTTTPLSYTLVPMPGLTAFCQVVFDESVASWGPEAAITIGSTMLGIWPPDVDTEGRPVPADSLDQLRYRMAVEYALAGDSADAIQLMSEVVDTPTVADSSWIAPAKDFLRVYQVADDLFIACQATQACNLRDAFRTMVQNSATSDFHKTMIYLQAHGITIHSSGLMDFDQNGVDERWLIIQPNPGEKLEFWILYHAEHQVQAVFVQVFEAGEILPFFHQPAGSIPIFQFELHSGYYFKYLAADKMAYVQAVDLEYARPTIILDGYHQALNDLMAGGDPITIRQQMLSLFNSPRFAGDCIAFNICDQFHYTLALVDELSGDTSDAIDEYLWVWRNYGKSPYALPARLKFNYFPLPTWTRTPAPSSTTAPTRTITPTPTSTVTPTPTSTSTFTPTPTATIVPYPN